MEAEEEAGPGWAEEEATGGAVAGAEEAAVEAWAVGPVAWAEALERASGSADVAASWAMVTQAELWQLRHRKKTRHMSHLEGADPTSPKAVPGGQTPQK